LGSCYRGKTLGFKKVDACGVATEVGFQTTQDNWSCGTKMEDFGIPLWPVSLDLEKKKGEAFTLSITFSRELGQSIAKQTKRRSVSG
jgi:hypothetical protein